MNSLPDKPSELIRLAISDMQSCEGDPRYHLNMERWHHPSDDICHVCMAGSIMAKTLGLQIDESINLSWKLRELIREEMKKFSTFNIEGQEVLFKKLSAIDSFRQGFLDDGLDFLGKEIPLSNLDKIYEALPFLNFLPYNNQFAKNLPKFYQDMLAIADEFEKYDL